MSIDVPLFDLRLSEDTRAEVQNALLSQKLNSGEYIAEFEEQFSSHLNAKYAVAVTNCTAALHLACLAAGIGPGDEVIVPSYTFVASANAVLYCGAKPVFADIIGPENLNIDPISVRNCITSKTKAVVAVHFGGYPAAVDQLATLCAENNLFLIEDAAHAPNSTLDGRKVGTFGHASAFSFFSNKVLPIGEGGLLATNNQEVAKTAAQLRGSFWLQDGKGDHNQLPLDYRIDDIRCAFALAQLKTLESSITQRQRLVDNYRREFKQVNNLMTPFNDADVSTSSCYVMPIMLNDAAARREVREQLKAAGIQTSILYPAVHEFTAYRQLFGAIELPNTEDAAARELTIPLYPSMSTEEQERVIEAVKEAVR